MRLLRPPLPWLFLFLTCALVGCGGDVKNETGGGLAGFPVQCPNFESGACNDPIEVLTCEGIATCLECINMDAVDQAITLYYGDLVDTDPVLDKDLNKCQQTIGKATTKYMLAKDKILQKCWDKRYNGKHSADCPDILADPALEKDSLKAAAKIAKAESKKIASISRTPHKGSPTGIIRAPRQG